MYFSERRVKLLTFAALLGISLTSYAQQNDELDDIAVGLSDSVLPNDPHSSPIALTVIDRRMIEASGARNIGELLRIVPGVVVGNRFGHSLSVGSHGSAEEYMRRTNIIVDGRSVFTPTIGGMISFNIPGTIEDIERIEVYRAPSHAETGSNSMVNTIRIFTARAMEREGTSFKVRRGQQGIQDNFVQHGSQLGNVAYTVSYNQRKDDGLINREDTRNTEQVFLRMDTALTDQDELSLTAGYGESDIDFWAFSNFDTDTHDAEDRSWFLNSSWNHIFSDGTDFSLNLNHTVMDRESYYLSGPQPGFGRVLWTQGYSFDSSAAEGKFVKAWNAEHSSSFSVKYGLDRVEGDSLFIEDDYKIENSSAFGNHSWRFLEDTVLTLGFMTEKSTITSKKANAYLATLLHELNSEHNLRISYNTGTRLPILYEQEAARSATLIDAGGVKAYDFYSVNELDPERVDQYSASWLFKSEDNRLFSELRFFVDKYRSIVYSAMAPNPGVLSPTGAYILSTMSVDDPSTVKGVEMSVDWRPSSQWMIVASASYADADSNLEGDQARNIAVNTPSSTFTLLSDYKIDSNWKVGGMYSRVSEYNWVSGWDLDRQESLDLYVQRCFADLNFPGACLRGSGVNILGDQANFRPEAQSPRAYWVEASLAF